MIITLEEYKSMKGIYKVKEGEKHINNLYTSRFRYPHTECGKAPLYWVLKLMVLKAKRISQRIHLERRKNDEKTPQAD